MIVFFRKVLFPKIRDSVSFIFLGYCCIKKYLRESIKSFKKKTILFKYGERTNYTKIVYERVHSQTTDSFVN